MEFSALRPLLCALLFACSTAVISAEQARTPDAERTGKDVVDAVCASCHLSGAQNAPRIGDKKVWDKLSARGLSSLTESAIKGIRQMPPHGGGTNLTDDEIKRAVTYMVNQSGGNWVEPLSRKAPPAERAGGDIVRTYCAKCHQKGERGAPPIGDVNAWRPRLKEGLDAVVRSAINGHGGMAPRGGVASLTDSELRAAVTFMINPDYAPAKGR